MKRFFAVLVLVIVFVVSVPLMACADSVTLTGIVCPSANTDYTIDIKCQSSINGGTTTLQTNYETRTIVNDDEPFTVTMKARSDANGMVRVYLTYIPGQPPLSVTVLVCR